MVSNRTTCGFCGCGCGLYVVGDHDVVGVIPSDNDAVNEGRLCIRGWHIFQPLRDTERILYPMLKSDGEQRRATYSDAISSVAEALRGLSPNQVAVIGSATGTNESAYVTAKFARAVIGTNNVDFPGRAKLMPTLLQLLSSSEGISMLSTFEDLADADVFLCIGMGASDRYPQVTARIFKAIIEGRHLLLIDTWHSDFASYASLHLSPKPFSEALVLRALARAIDPNVPMPFDEESMRSIAGLSNEQVKAAADLLLGGKRIAAIYDTASLIHMCAPQCVGELLRLLKVLRSKGVHWCGVMPMVERCNSNGALRMGVAPMLLPGLKGLNDADAIQRACSVWGIEKLPQDSGMQVSQMLSAAESGELKGLIIIGDDLLTDFPDVERLLAAFERLELLVTISSYQTPLSEISRCVFPRAIWGEVEGTFTNMEGRLRRLVKIREPMGEAKEDWQVLCDIAAQLGYEMRYSSSFEIMGELKRISPDYSDLNIESIIAGKSFLRESSTSAPKCDCQDEIKAAKLPDVSGEFPLLLFVERYYLPWHSDTLALHSSTLRREFRLRFTPYVFVNSAQGHSLGLRDGMPAFLKTPRGSARVTSVFNDAVPSGIAILPEMFFSQLRQAVGQERFDEVTGATIYPVTVASLERTR